MGLLNKLFGTRKNAQPEPTMTAAMAERIVRDYGAVLKFCPVPGTVADVQELPYPKERIKQALVFALKATADSKIRESLKIGYISLACWQEGVGPSRLGIDVTKMDPNDNPLELAKRMVVEGADMDKWNEAVKAEEQALESELQELGF